MSNQERQKLEKLASDCAVRGVKVETVAKMAEKVFEPILKAAKQTTDLYNENIEYLKKLNPEAFEEDLRNQVKSKFKDSLKNMANDINQEAVYQTHVMGNWGRGNGKDLAATMGKYHNLLEELQRKRDWVIYKEHVIKYWVLSTDNVELLKRCNAVYVGLPQKGEKTTVLGIEFKEVKGENVADLVVEVE